MHRLTPFISAILIIIFIIAGIFFWLPKYQEFRQGKAFLEKNIKALEEKNDYYSNLRTFSIKLNSHKEEMDKINCALPKEESLPTLFDFIQKASLENGLILNKISSSNVTNSNKKPSGKFIAPSENSKIKKVSLSISLVGSYDAFKSFISSIYKSARLFEVSSIQFSPLEEISEKGEKIKREGLFSFDLTLKTYILPESEIQKGEVVSP